MNRKKLILIFDTAASIQEFKKRGFFSRQKNMLEEYKKHFDLELYTSDIKNYSIELNIKHHNLPVRLSSYGLRHIVYYIYLILSSFKMNAPIRVFGVSLPVLPLIKIMSGQKIILNYEYDWARGVRKDYGGFKGLISNIVQRLSISSSDKVVCTAAWLQEIVKKRYRKDAIIIPNFVDTGLFKPSENKKNYILYAGRLHWSKGISILLQAFARLHKLYPEMSLLICGSGDQKSELENIVKEEKIKNVIFKGTIEHDVLANLVARAKIFVLPTLTMEGHPKSLIEAMACGTACIATDIPGNRDVIIHNETGLLVTPRSVNSLYEALTTLSSDEVLRKKLEKSAYIFAQQNYSIEKTLLKEIEVIQGFISHG